MKAIECPKPRADGRRIATEVFFEKDVLTDQSETLYSNCFVIRSVPQVIYKFAVNQDYFDQVPRVFPWACRQINDSEALSFHHPSGELQRQFGIREIGGYSWRNVQKIEWDEKGDRKWIKSVNLVMELLRKSLIAKCHQKGLLFNPDTKLHYFPDGLLLRNRLSVLMPNNDRPLALAACGQKKFFKPNDLSEYYKYHLAPTFSVKGNLFETFVAVLRIRIHLTDLSGTALVGPKINSRRKHLCKSWWNDHWFKRVLGVMRFLADNENIVIGDIPKERVVVSAHPISFRASGGIDESALEMSSFERESLFLAADDESVENLTEGTE